MLPKELVDYNAIYVYPNPRNLRQYMALWWDEDGNEQKQVIGSYKPMQAWVEQQTKPVWHRKEAPDGF